MICSCDLNFVKSAGETNQEACIPVSQSHKPSIRWTPGTHRCPSEMQSLPVTESKCRGESEKMGLSAGLSPSPPQRRRGQRWARSHNRRGCWDLGSSSWTSGRGVCPRSPSEAALRKAVTMRMRMPGARTSGAPFGSSDGLTLCQCSQ